MSHDVRIMANYMLIQDVPYFIKVSWLILSIVCGADVEGVLTNNVRTFKRSAIDDEPLQFSTYHNHSESDGIAGEIDIGEENILNTMLGNESSKENNKGFFPDTEYTKTKANSKLRNAESDHKTFNFNKVDVEMKHIAVNGSYKLVSETTGQENNLKSKNKNEFNLNFTNPASSSGNISENKREKLSLSTDIRYNTALELANMNNTHLITGKPSNTTGSILSNITSTNVDDLNNLISLHNTSAFNESNDTSAGSRITDSPEDVDILVMSGVGLGSVLILALIAGAVYIVYRRQIWNKPQTLSDKCSNADSSGYIDDSTLRENSEEMYSLDNDSFLNSLEAMTIQNYWTDSVKHTKL